MVPEFVPRQDAARDDEIVFRHDVLERERDVRECAVEDPVRALQALEARPLARNRIVVHVVGMDHLGEALVRLRVHGGDESLDDGVIGPQSLGVLCARIGLSFPSVQVVADGSTAVR